MATKIQIRGDKASNWMAENPVLMDRELALIKERSSGPYTSMKIGNGTDRFLNLPEIGFDVKSVLTPDTLDDPFGFGTNMPKWVDSFKDDRSYFFRLVLSSGRTVGHVWMYADSDYRSSSNIFPHYVHQIVLTSLSPDSNGILSSASVPAHPCFWYRVFCVMPGGATPDGGAISGNLKWSKWCEYRNYVIDKVNGEIASIKESIKGWDNALKGVDVSAYSYAFRYVGNLVDEDSVKAKDKLVRLLNSYCTTADDRTLSEILAIYKSGASELLPYTGTLRGQVNGVPFTVRQNTSSWGKFYTQTLIGPFVFSGGYFNTASGVEHTWIRSIDTSGTDVNYGDWHEPVASISTGVLNLGTLADETTILSRAAQYAIISDPFIAIITAQYLVSTAVQSIVIHQQVTKNSDGSGVCMQYIFKDKARWTRYINFNSAGRVTETQPLQSDIPRNLHLTDNGGLSLRGLWGGAVGSGITLPNKNDLREGTPTATSVPLVLTKAIKDTVTCNLGPATTARAGVMTVEQVKALQSATKKTTQIYELGSFATLSELDAAAAALVDGTIQWATNYLPCILLGYYETDCKAIYWQVVENYDEPCVQQIRFSESGKLYRRRILLNEMDFNNGQIIAEQVLDWYAVVKVTATPVYIGGGLCLQLNAEESTTSAPLPIATADKPGIMSAAQVQKLANLEARIAALEAK